MKKKIVIGVMLTIFLLFSSIKASDKEKVVSGEKYNKVVDNLLVGVESKNDGLRISSAFHLGEYKATKSVIALMRILHDDKNENARISAALALIKVGDARGTYAVKRAAVFDESERVKRVCEKFYLDYLQKQKAS
jgi:hypothetical protein